MQSLKQVGDVACWCLSTQVSAPQPEFLRVNGQILGVERGDVSRFVGHDRTAQGSTGAEGLPSEPFAQIPAAFQ